MNEVIKLMSFKAFSMFWFGIPYIKSTFTSSKIFDALGMIDDFTISYWLMVGGGFRPRGEDIWMGEDIWVAVVGLGVRIS